MEMSNLWFNIRFGFYHWKWGPDEMVLVKNLYWVDVKRMCPMNYKRFEVYTLFGKNL